MLNTNKNIKHIMSFGKMPLANKFLTKEDFKNEEFYEMSVGFDEKLKLFQLMNFPSPINMFDENYAFFSASSEYMKYHFQKFSENIKLKLKKKSGMKKIIEIGCNDGIMLQNFFDNQQFEHLGIEPSKNVYVISKEKNLNVINEFFSFDLTKSLGQFVGQTDVICAANVICHIPNILDLFKGIENLLNKRGLFVFEEPYLGDVIKKISYDQIYDEHIYLFSIMSIQNICNIFGLEIVDVEPQITHGGSMRYFIGRKNEHEISNNFHNFLNYEKNLGLDNFNTYIEFKRNCEKSRDRLLSILKSLKDQNKKVSGYAATSKSTTILNYCNIGEDLIDCIYDTTPIKINKFSPGMHIPIKDYKFFKEDKPEFSFLFGWNHKNEIFNKERNYIKNGGNWISHIESLI